MNMVCNEEDTYNPPFPDPRQFNVGRLGRYSSQYYDQWTYRITEDLDSGKMRGKHILHRGKVWRPTESVDKNPGGVRSPSEDKGPDTVWPFSELYDDDELGDDDASGDDDESDESEDEDYVVIHAVHLSTAKR